MSSFDYVLVGGGLQSGLIALALRARQPDATIALFERGPRLGGNHTWCFHDGDVSNTARAWLDPLVEWSWDGYDVRFPGWAHRVADRYSGLSGERLHEVVTESVTREARSVVRAETEVEELLGDRVRLPSGEVVRGTAVIDARGPDRWPTDAPAGYQKFVGVEVELSAPHGLERPVLMDAEVDQTDGYRFFYVLPLSPSRLLVEDTRFHDSPALDRDLLRAEVDAYIERRGWHVVEQVREEAGVLPMPWSHRIDPPGRGPLRAGYRGGWFHPGTGYSFPIACRLAEFVASRPAAELFGHELDRFAREHRAAARFPRFLNRLMFRWYPPDSRRPIFERVYRMPRSTIRNFYALSLTWPDRRRLLVGRPPRGLSIRYRIRSSSFGPRS